MKFCFNFQKVLIWISIGYELFCRNFELVSNLSGIILKSFEFSQGEVSALTQNKKRTQTWLCRRINLRLYALSVIWLDQYFNTDMHLESWILSGMSFLFWSTCRAFNKIKSQLKSIILRDNLQDVYLQSDDMGGISFTTGRRIHKIRLAKYAHQKITYIYSDVADTSVVGTRWRCRFSNWWILRGKIGTKRNFDCQ